MSDKVLNHTLFTDLDIHLFREGKHFKLYEKLGAHLCVVNEVAGCYFAVWAPNALQVSVMGEFNFWDKKSHNLFPRWDASGIWEGFVPNITAGCLYKYAIQTNDHTYIEKGDPFALTWEKPPKTASVVWDASYEWKDHNWLNNRHKINSLDAPISVYELHLGSWKHKENSDKQWLTYRELASELIPYVKEMGFTHVEFMPIMEYPFYGSWGYQITGYFAPTSRFGSPQDFMFLVDSLHQNGIGLILDWVPSHFPLDDHGLFKFDGTSLYEHEDSRKGYHPDWKSYIFNYGRNEVKAFLISNAIFWFDKYHADGLRVDAVASMLYLDYSRESGEWIPNNQGGRENLEAITFIKELNEEIYRLFPDVQTFAEESTSWPMVSKPTFSGGLGFGLKWMMGWMNDTLQYFKLDTIYRQYHQNNITFSLTYAFTENFVLPLSHDEVVHGKGSLLSRMPGDDWQRFANLRLLFSYMFTHPGAKLLFMGNELAQSSEWNHEEQLSWWLLQYNPHLGIQNLVKELNKCYRNHPALYQKSYNQEGFQWIDYSDRENSVLVYLRKGKIDKEQLLVICNFTPQAFENYQVGVTSIKELKEIFNSDDARFGGSHWVNTQKVKPIVAAKHGQKYTATFKVPPLGVAIYAFH